MTTSEQLMHIGLGFAGTLLIIILVFSIDYLVHKYIFNK
jgi:hypothetical protein